jgi:hypothetical protein
MLRKIENRDRYRTADKHYYHLRDGETDYLFSDSQLETAEERALNNPEDLAGWTEPKGTFWLGMIYGTVLGTLLCWTVYELYTSLVLLDAWIG